MSLNKLIYSDKLKLFNTLNTTNVASKCNHLQSSLKGRRDKPGARTRQGRLNTARITHKKLNKASLNKQGNVSK